VVVSMDERNDLFFKIDIEGTLVVPSAVNLVCECEGAAFSFRGRISDERNVFRFEVPAIKSSTIVPDKLYNSRIEVILDDRYFVPINFDMKFRKPVTIMAEAMVTKKTSIDDRSERNVSVRARTLDTAELRTLRQKYAADGFGKR
jgi:hypothetical protein